MLVDRLKNYKLTQSRITILDIRIRELYEHIGSLRCESMQDRIESRVFKAPAGEPVQSGTTGDPTAMIAFCSNQQEIQAARQKISEYRVQKDALQHELDEIDAALAVLNEPELFIVEEYYISGYSWRQVLLHWENRRGEYKSERWARDRRDIAIQKMEKALLIA